MFDIVRGHADGSVRSSQSNASNFSGSDAVYGYLSSFDSDGFKLKAGSTNSNATNQDDTAYIAWAFKAGGAPSGNLPSIGDGTSGTVTSGAGAISSGFSGLSAVTQSVNRDSGLSITKYTGGTAPADATGALGSFPHNLGEAPDLVIVKSTHSTNSWAVWHSGLTNASTSGAGVGNVYLDLDTNEQTNSNGQSDHGTIQEPSSTTITLRKGGTSSLGVNNYSGAYICYAWKAVSGVSAFGTLSNVTSAPTQSTDETWCGFKPRLVILKKYDASGPWHIFDAYRNSTDTWGNRLRANTSNGEDAPSNAGIVVSTNGFYTQSDSAMTGNNLIWMAFA